MDVTTQTGRNPAHIHFRGQRTISTHGGKHYDNTILLIGRYLLKIETSDSLFDKHNTFLDE